MNDVAPHAAEKVFVEIALSAIVVDAAAQIRAGGTDPAVVADYADAMEQGAAFPPVILFHDGDEHFAADGFHRIAAATAIGRTAILAEVRRGTARDAILYAVGANDTHGLRRSQADRRNAVLTLLRDPEWTRLSDRKIAEAARVDHKTVARTRRELTGEFPTRQVHSPTMGNSPPPGADSGSTMVERVLRSISDAALMAEVARRGLEIPPVNYHALKQLAAETGIGATKMLALTTDNDPFYAGQPGRQQAGRWFARIWQSFGWTSGLHLRRIHYALVSQESPVLKPDGTPYENTDHDWKLLGKASLAARYLKLVPSDGLVDRRNPAPIIFAVNEAIAGAVPEVEVFPEDPAFDYELPPDLNLDDTLLAPSLSLAGAPGGMSALANGQPFLVELWVEKTTMNDILVPLAERLRVNLVAGSGETSETFTRAAVDRAIVAERPMRILYISDFDPGGRSMPVSLARKIEFILRDNDFDLDITLQPILLLPEQCEHYRLPRTPLKATERRAARFEQRFGEGATELDALEALYPGELAAIVEREVCRYIDPTLAARCGRAFWELQRSLNELTQEVRQPYYDQLVALNERYAEIQAGLQTAIDEARGDLENLEADAEPLWSQITDDLEQVMPEIDPKDVPTARPADPVDEPLFDSSREYFDQLDHYHLWQGRLE